MNMMIVNNVEISRRPPGEPLTVALGGLGLRPRTLPQAVQDAVDALPEAAFTPLDGDSAQPLAQARAMLALLVRSYAEQIYGSAAVASRIPNDSDFPWPWWEALPDASALSRFRAANRSALQLCLTAALRFQVEEKIAAGEVTRIHLPRLAEEARRRITMAAFADSLELATE
jgi:hypothetical protein